ncbi:protein FAM227B-like [Spea bombifrons]|uniref:protein FAM227B-like n=1 Tax=Spea bombifrons TaxID=233779 RepID=UPI00234B7F0F|nr:protein FAM227B-like [Spea bombifrons]
MQRPPAMLEEFLEFQDLNDWPHSPLEESLTVACTLDAAYPLDVINKDLHENTSFSDKAFVDLEANICQNTSLLDKYASQILNLHFSDDHMDSSNEAFLTEVDVSGSTVKGRSQEDIKELKGNTRRKKKLSVESSVFPGFKRTEVTELPGQLEPVQVLNHVAENQNFKVRTQYYTEEPMLQCLAMKNKNSFSTGSQTTL